MWCNRSLSHACRMEKPSETPGRYRGPNWWVERRPKRIEARPQRFEGSTVKSGKRMVLLLPQGESMRSTLAGPKSERIEGQRSRTLFEIPRSSDMYMCRDALRSTTGQFILAYLTVYTFYFTVAIFWVGFILGKIYMRMPWVVTKSSYIS